MRTVMRRTQLPSGEELRYNGASNAYFLSTGRCINARQIVSTYFPFDPKIAAPHIAAKRGVSPEVVLREWEESVFISRIVRARITARMLGYPPPLDRQLLQSTNVQAYMNGVDAAAQLLKTHFNVIEVDMMVADDKRGIASTIDFVLRSKATQRLCVGAWRISGTPRGKFFLNGFDEGAAAPLRHLANNSATRSAVSVLLDGQLFSRGGFVERLQRSQISQSADDVDYGHVTIRRGMFEEFELEFKKVDPSVVLPPDDPSTTPNAVLNELLDRSIGLIPSDNLIDSVLQDLAT